MELQPPEIVRKGGSYAVRIKASAPSIHMLRADRRRRSTPWSAMKSSRKTWCNISWTPVMATKKLWQSNLFADRSTTSSPTACRPSLRHMPETARYKFKSALTRILNDGSGGLICILL